MVSGAPVGRRRSRRRAYVCARRPLGPRSRTRRGRWPWQWPCSRCPCPGSAGRGWSRRCPGWTLGERRQEKTNGGFKHKTNVRSQCSTGTMRSAGPGHLHSEEGFGLWSDYKVHFLNFFKVIHWVKISWIYPWTETDTDLLQEDESIPRCLEFIIDF